MCSQVLHGWRFWSVEGTEPPKREPKAKTDKPAKATKESAAKKPKTNAAKKGGKTKSTKKGKSARMVSGESYGCGACGESFPTMKAATEHALTHTS